LLEGLDVGLDGGAENLDAVALVGSGNAAPALDLDADDSGGVPAGGFAATFTEDGPSVAVADVDATLSDADDATLQSLTVTITNLLDGAAESLSANTGGTSIAAAYDPGTGVLSLNGVDTVANYQQVLRTIAYENTSAELEQQASDDPDWLQIVELTADLLDICRATQRSYFSNEHGEEPMAGPHRRVEAR